MNDCDGFERNLGCQVNAEHGPITGHRHTIQDKISRIEQGFDDGD